MARDFSLTRQEVDTIVSELIKGLTLNGELQCRAETTHGVADLIQLSAKFIDVSSKAASGVRRFRLTVTVNDQSQYAVAALEGIYPVFNMVPKVRETKYTAMVPGEDMRIVELNENPLMSDDIVLILIPKTDLKYKQSLTRAMQLMKAIEKELARKFES